METQLFRMYYPLGLSNKWKLDHAEKWYDHKPPMVIENEDVKILQDIKIQTDHVIEHQDLI